MSNSTTTETPDFNKALEVLMGGMFESTKKDILKLVDEKLLTVSTATRKITIKKPKEKPVDFDGLFHKQFEDVLLAVSVSQKPVALTGVSGAGKSWMARQIAEVLGVPFYCVSTTLQEHKLMGHSDAAGKLVKTLVYKAMETGGVLFFDELDSYCPNVTITLNPLLSDRYLDFPVEGMKYAPDNLYIMGAMNTDGSGATSAFNGRNKLDDAFLNRFSARIPIDYDEEIELATSPNPELTSWGQKVRRACNDLGMNKTLSNRQFEMLGTLVNAGMAVTKAKTYTVFAGFSDDQRKKALRQVKENELVEAEKAAESAVDSVDF